QLRYLVNRIQQAKNPYRQGILGIVHNFSKNKNEIHNYIQQLSFFDDDHIMILCMTKEQAIKLYETKYFQIDLTYKSIQSKINVFELNKYDENHQINWIQFYNQPWVLASLNQHCSKINTEIWCIVGETTNVAESAHADINRDGKELSLMNAIE
ncbi:10895_t:CDS:2, partial [Racocetra persica]